MSKMRLKFSKLGMGKYISHLDLLRTFTRAIHRAELPVRYSQGFNPHQLITFALPLALGTTSETEFVDIDFEDGTDMKLVVEGLNRCLPPDIKILEASVPLAKAKDIFSAEYIFDFLFSQSVQRDLVEKFFEMKDIPAVKKTKRGEKEINLSEFIYEHEILMVSNDNLRLRAIISAGGENNIKPEILANKLCQVVGIEAQNVEVHRTKIFYSDGKNTRLFE